MAGSGSGFGFGKNTKGNESLSPMESTTRNFKDLIAWQRAMDLIPVVYGVLRGFPSDERFGLCDQIRRSTISVSANIAEGQGRHHPKEFVHFLGIARGSLAELESLLIASQRLAYITEEQLNELVELIVTIRRPLYGLVQKLSDSETLTPAHTNASRNKATSFGLPSRTRTLNPNP